MRILQIVNRPQRRGAETFALDLCRQLDSEGHPTRIVHLYAGPPSGARLMVRPIDLELTGRSDHPAERFPGWHPGLFRRLLAAIDAFDPDVVQVNGSRTVKYGSLARRLRRRKGWGLVYRSIGTPTDWLRGPLHRFLYRRLVISGVDGIVAVSEATRRSLEREYAPDVPLAVIPRGVDLERFVPETRREAVRRGMDTPPERPVMLYVGSLSSEKRPDRLLRVAAEAVRKWRPEAGQPAAELWMAGDGPLRAEVERASLEAPAALRVLVLGCRSDIASIMEAADLLLLTSDTEGSPGVVLEAGAAGLPAAALAVGGVAELVVDGETGVLAAAGDEAALAAGIAGLLATPERRRFLGAAARRRVEERYSIDRVAGRMLDYYRHVLNRRRGTA